MIKTTVELLPKLIAVGIVTKKEEEEDRSLFVSRTERKLLCAKTTKKKLNEIGQEMVLVSEKPMLRIRASVAGMSTCTANKCWEILSPHNPMHTTQEFRPNENVFIVDV